jgi:hypothetical protein
MKYIAIIFGLMFSSTTIACSFDTDCGVGSECVKQSGALEGICVGGMTPGNDYDSDPYQAEFDENENVGQTCEFDIDCGIGSDCVKSSGNIEGVCM